MAYLNASFMDPRISFSNDFADSSLQSATAKLDEISKYKEAPVSSDFEFSVKNYAMIPADEIFCDGMLLPLKNDNCSCSNRVRKMTLHEELLVDDDGDGDEFDGRSTRMPKSSGWWRKRFGMKKNQNLSRKVDGNGILEKVKGEKIHVFVHEQDLLSQKTQNCLSQILECDD